VVDRLLNRGRDRDTATDASPGAAPGAAPAGTQAPQSGPAGTTARAASAGQAEPGDTKVARDAVWARVQLARNPRRPHSLELIGHVADTFVELHGDRLFGEDGSIVAGLGRIAGRRVVIVGNQKGADTDENIRRNFGMSKPEGLRKAIRCFELAGRFGLPVITFVDTPGAYPGAEAEERGIAEAIATSIMVMSRLRVPIVTVITGEGGSGGALAIAVGNVVLALENAVYAVISPEGCASILWRTSEKAADAALAMKMTAAEQAALGVIDRVISEPGEGAHTDVPETAKRIRAAIVAELDRLATLAPDELVAQRWRRYRDFGAFIDEGPAEVVPTERAGGITDRLRKALDQVGGALGGRGRDPRENRDGRDARDGRDGPPAREEV
jgi:acetyl-CoA carboxylase carboxyl transferase alpha subunit